MWWKCSCLVRYLMGHWHSLGVQRLWSCGAALRLEAAAGCRKASREQNRVPSAVRKLRWSDSCSKHSVLWGHRGLWSCEVLGHDTGMTFPQLTALARALGAV